VSARLMQARLALEGDDLSFLRIVLRVSILASD
jgi:hypothetical protein